MKKVNAITRCVALCTIAVLAFAGDEGSSATGQPGGFTSGRYVIASGGTLGALSTHYVHYGTAGQTVVDACQSSNRTLKSGVWHLWAMPTGVSPPDAPAIPTAYALHQNYPNPFNPTTIIKYELPRSSMVRLSVYDILGREAYVLVNEMRKAGVYEVAFDASRLASGVYLYRLVAGDFTATRRMILVR